MIPKQHEKYVFLSVLINRHIPFFCITALLAFFCPYVLLNLSHHEGLLVFQGMTEKILYGRGWYP